MNALQEAIHDSFRKFCIYYFSLRYEFFVHYALKVEKIYQRALDAGALEFQFLRPRGCLTNPFWTLSLCFWVIGKTPGFISRKNFVKKIFVCIGHRYNVLARCDSIFPLLRCQGVWNKTCTQHSLSQILFRNPKNYSLGDDQRFCCHSWCDSTQNCGLSKTSGIASKGFQIISENNYLVSSPCWSKDFTWKPIGQV